jgi:uncharacterized SAM-binding protein YcdF (DUF218 family)
MNAEESLRPAPQLSSHQLKSTSARWRRRIVWLLLGGITGYYLVICFEIVWQSRRDEARPADVIVVFGAAEYSGHPSPVLRARLDHAITLYSQGIAPYLITTGGSGGDPQFSEGGVGRDYLESRGISERHLIAETQGENTAESAERVAVIMRANNMRTCVVVSDPYHLYRIKQLMQRQRIITYASPRPHAFGGLWFSVGHVMREAFSYLTQRVRPA